MASDTGTIDLTRVAAERRRLEEEAARAAHDAEVEHPAIVAQRIVDEVLRQAQEGSDASDRLPVDDEDDGSRAIARRIVSDVLADEEAIDRAARAAAEVTARHEAEAAAAEIRESVDEDAEALAPAEERRIDRVYLVVPNGDSPLVLLPGATVDPDTRPYIPALHGELQPQGSDGAALVERALAPLTRSSSPWRQIADAAEPHRGPTQYVAWFALVGMWLVAMAALIPLMFQSMVQTVDATPPDFWDDSAVVEDGAPAGDEGIENPEELLDS